MKKYSKARYYAVLILKEVLENGRWANKLLTYYSFRLKSNEVNLLSALVNGTVKQKLFADWVLKNYVKPEKFEKLTPWIRTILRMGVYQLYFLDRVPPYAVINESVELAKRFGHRGTAGLVNAVLKNINRDRIQPDSIWIKLSHPEWLYRLLVEKFGEEKAIKIMEHNNMPPLIFVRVNTLKISPESFENLLQKMGVGYRRFSFPPVTFQLEELPHLAGIPDELYYVQDLSSQVIPYLLEPSGWVLDMAGAPGGKISHSYQLNPEILAISVELHLSRAKEIKRLAGRLGARIHVVNGDSTYISFKSQFDRILLDAPCSGLGTLRRHAELRWRMRPERIKELVEIQKKLLENAVNLLKPGGILVYSTCTITTEENEGIVRWFTERFKGFSLEPAVEHIPQKFTDNGFLFVDGVEFGSDFSFGVRFRRG